MKAIKGIVPKDVKAGAWRKIAGFDPLKDNEINFDETIEKIAIVYGLTTEEVAEELTISEVLPVYLDCVRFVNDLVFSKLNQIPESKKKVK